MSFNLLSSEEIANIELKYKKLGPFKDEIMNLRTSNLQKIQPWIKISKKQKKKYNYKSNLVDYTNDPYLFLEKPKDLKNIIINLAKNKIGLSTLAYKCNIKYHLLDNYLHKKYYTLDNSKLYKILTYLNYDLNTQKIFNKENINKESEHIDLDNIQLQKLDLESLDLHNIDVSKL